MQSGEFQWLIVCCVRVGIVAGEDMLQVFHKTFGMERSLLEEVSLLEVAAKDTVVLESLHLGVERTFRGKIVVSHVAVGNIADNPYIGILAGLEYRLGRQRKRTLGVVVGIAIIAPSIGNEATYGAAAPRDIPSGTRNEVAGHGR